ncbi:ABC transporter ATP-binding protein [Actinoplanes utahensis]|uniref:ABC transporter ATP-binding protein n=1 Tax=Actinoplanes utahensis TaxID=1869 RepID=UPI00068F6034|nr:ABC transporter ATP-binding protein [Actinoplanes utahensis]GIF32456.1 multidrug ABC transporter permease/ATP-binding protein [Actinoplanes utahensis]
MRRILGWALRDSGPRLSVAWLFGLLYQGGLLALPICLGRALDQGIRPGDDGRLLFWVGALLAVSVALTAGEFGMRWFGVLGASRTGNRLVARLADHVLRLDRHGVQRYGSGDLITRSTRDVEAVHTFLAGAPTLLSGLLGCAAVIVSIALLEPVLAVVGLATLPLLVLVNLWYPPRFERSNQQVSQAHAERADAVEDLLTAGLAARGLGGEHMLVRRHHERSATVTDRTLSLARITANWSAHAPFLPALALAVGVLVGGLSVLDGALTVGGLVTFAGWMSLLSLQVERITGRFAQVGAGWTAAGRIAEVLDIAVAVTDPDRPVPLPARGDLIATGLRAELPGRTLTWPDLHVTAGEFVAITGPVGTGKTTLLRLLARLEDPAAGTVRYGGVPLPGAALTDLRARITGVPQRPVLLSGTIADNLRLGRPELTDEELRAACHAAAFDVDALPDGYATEVGERGDALSGGQVQRLALARALLRRPSVLLLDDVTSAVDGPTETALLDRLRGWLPDATIIAATSRPAVAERADRVIELRSDLAEVAHG